MGYKKERAKLMHAAHALGKKKRKIEALEKETSLEAEALFQKKTQALRETLDAREAAIKEKELRLDAYEKELERREAALAHAEKITKEEAKHLADEHIHRIRQDHADLLKSVHTLQAEEGRIVSMKAEFAKEISRFNNWRKSVIGKYLFVEGDSSAKEIASLRRRLAEKTQELQQLKTERKHLKRELASDRRDAWKNLMQQRLLNASLMRR